MTITGRLGRGATALASAVLLCFGLSAAGDLDGSRGNHYVQTNLVSDVPGLAMVLDPDLQNAWGISMGPTSPFWVSDNGTGKTTLYHVGYSATGAVSAAKLGLVVTIPGEGSITGQVFNPTPSFNGDRFLFASEDGTISGWRPSLGTAAEVLVPASSAAYKGMTLAMGSSQPLLLAANFSAGTIDVFDAGLVKVGAWSDPLAPVGYSPFNVQDLGGVVVVTYALRNPVTGDDVSGPGNGFIDTLNVNTGAFRRLATGHNAGGRLHAINSPWGLAIAPAGFGRFAGNLLVGNFGSGTIMAFDLASGRFRGLLARGEEMPLVIPGLWGIAFGNGGSAGRPGTLYFSAGPDHEAHGLFGAIDYASRRFDD